VNRADWIERARKRELRTIFRDKRLEAERAKRSAKKELAEKKTRALEMAADALLNDNKKNGKPERKPGAEKFLPMYSYIPVTPFDLRRDIPPSWRPHSFNERKQHLEFVRRFVYPYPIPEALLFATHRPETELDYRGVSHKAHDRVFIRLAKGWVGDIASGKSFHGKNRKYFTKAEAHYFLSSKMPHEDGYSVPKLYFYAKCRARAIDHKTSETIADVFAFKFFDQFRNCLIEGFLDLLARTRDYRIERRELGDMCDFVKEKINENKKRPGNRAAFSFSGRTVSSVVALANEWHERLRKEADARDAAHRGRRDDGAKEPLCASRWKGTGIERFSYEAGECVWVVTELLTAKELFSEGRRMKSCLSSYAFSCAAGDSAIFSLERVYPISGVVEKNATLEVAPSRRTLVQARGKCNGPLATKAMSVVKRWAAANGITVRLMV